MLWAHKSLGAVPAAGSSMALQPLRYMQEAAGDYWPPGSVTIPRGG